MVSSQWSVVRGGWPFTSIASTKQIAEAEAFVAQGALAESPRHGAGERRTVEDEGVELTVFAAGIDARRQVGQERGVIQPARERRIERLGIDATQHGAKA